MKKIIGASLIALAVTVAACNNSNTEKQQATAPVTDTPSTTAATAVATPESPVKEVLDGYLKLKNALATDNSRDAAVGGSKILTAMFNIDTAAMQPSQRKAYLAVADDIKENAEHISTNGGKIEHQREHFEMLSKDVYDLVKAFGAGRTVYKDFCPMAMENKGAFWVSETKEIRNPYFGSSMQECGEVKEELK